MSDKYTFSDRLALFDQHPHEASNVAPFPRHVHTPEMVRSAYRIVARGASLDRELAKRARELYIAGVSQSQALADLRAHERTLRALVRAVERDLETSGARHG